MPSAILREDITWLIWTKGLIMRGARNLLNLGTANTDCSVKLGSKRAQKGREIQADRHSVAERLILYDPIVNTTALLSVLKAGRAPPCRKSTVKAFCSSSGCKLNFEARPDAQHLIIPHHLLFSHGARSHCWTNNGKEKKEKNR